MSALWKLDMYGGYRVVWSRKTPLDTPSWCLYTRKQTPYDSMCADWAFYKGGFKSKEAAHKWIDEKKEVKMQKDPIRVVYSGQRWDLTCPDCGAPLNFIPESKYGPFYGCSKHKETGCKGAHGACSDGSPKGIPGDKETRAYRQQAIEAVSILSNHLPSASIEECQAIMGLAHSFQFSLDGRSKPGIVGEPK